MWNARVVARSATLFSIDRQFFNYAQIPRYQYLTNAKTDITKVNSKTTRAVANQSVADFYAGKSVFITGGTGFLGKVFIEKLLYSCKDIDKIYVLIRNKNGKTIQERIVELTEKPLFSRLKLERPDDLNKIVPVAGDITEPNLGMKPDDEQMFLDKASVVFHVAATIRFDERLDIAVNANVEGTRRILNVCRRMKHLKAFVHLSTAYTNCDRSVIDEVIYPPPAELSEVYTFLKQHGVADEDKVVKLLNGRPNTYIFTKGLAEALIAETHGDIPSVIIRPSIVSAAIHEPLEGWIDTWVGATSLVASTTTGLNRVLFGHKNNSLDLIPVDLVSNLSIVAASRCDSSEEVMVFNSCSSSCNPITLEQLTRFSIDYSSKHGFNDIPCPTLIFTSNKWVDFLTTYVLQITPAFVADVWLCLRGKSPRYVKLQSQVIQTRDALQYFTSHSWEVRCERARALFASLSARDRQVFPFDPIHIDWTQYIPIYCRGIKDYLLKK